MTAGGRKIINVDGFGVSTSGDYRNYFQQDGRRYSHTFDGTGAPSINWRR
jgi:thiamine biosynthesis lipoprotein